VVTKVEVEVNVGDDVVDVKVDESEASVVVEDEREVAAAESIFVVVSMRKLRRGSRQPTGDSRVGHLASLAVSSLSPLAQTLKLRCYHRIGTPRVARSRV
jgi:hypothetical protein